MFKNNLTDFRHKGMNFFLLHNIYYIFFRGYEVRGARYEKTLYIREPKL